jgi:hypothetical protein
MVLKWNHLPRLSHHSHRGLKRACEKSAAYVKREFPTAWIKGAEVSCDSQLTRHPQLPQDFGWRGKRGRNELNSR